MIRSTTGRTDTVIQTYTQKRVTRSDVNVSGVIALNTHFTGKMWRTWSANKFTDAFAKIGLRNGLGCGGGAGRIDEWNVVKRWRSTAKQRTQKKPLTRAHIHSPNCRNKPQNACQQKIFAKMLRNACIFLHHPKFNNKEFYDSFNISQCVWFELLNKQTPPPLPRHTYI